MNAESLPEQSRGLEPLRTRSLKGSRTSLTDSGIVYLVGAGPGDAGLLTLRGKELLEGADVVIYDGLVNRELLRFARPAAEIIYGGKHDRTRCVSQAELNALLLAKGGEGKCVVRLKGGDPFVFGRGGEEAEALAAAGIPFEVVPGVSSVHAVPGYAGIPLTHRHYASCVMVVTGHDAPSSQANKVDWPGLARVPGTLVVLMGLRNIKAIATTLMAHGRSADTPVAIVSRGTTGRQQTVVGTLDTLAELASQAGVNPPAVTVIGEVVKLREQLNWFEQRPLFGRRVAVTQRLDLACPLVAALREKGAEVLEVPATRWVPYAGPGESDKYAGAGFEIGGTGKTSNIQHPTSNIQSCQPGLDRAIAHLKAYDWILFTNPQGIDFFFQRFFLVHQDLRQLGQARLGAYGPRTGQRLRELRLQPAAVAADHKTPLIMEAITKCGGVRGQRFLVLRGDVAHEKVPEALEALGAAVDVVACYSVVPEKEDLTGGAAALVEEGADWIVFASGLAIEHFNERFDLPGLLARFPHTRLAIASDTIQWALNKLGLAPSVIARANDVEDLVSAIIRMEMKSQEQEATAPLLSSCLINTAVAARCKDALKHA
jgi:uroporphyrinogen III methyltransferase / synthase